MNLVFYAQSTSKVISERERKGGRERERHQAGVCGNTGVYTILYGSFPVSKREGGMEGEGYTSSVYGDTAVYTSLYRPFPVSK